MLGMSSGMGAQEHAPAAPAAAAAAASHGFSVHCPAHSSTKPGPADIIMPHLTDSKHFEVPWVCGWDHWAAEVTLPTWNVHIGGMTVDLAPTKHVVFLILTGLIVTIVLVLVARGRVKAPVTLAVASGDELRVWFERSGDSFRAVTLAGPVATSFEGTYFWTNPGDSPRPRS